MLSKSIQTPCHQYNSGILLLFHKIWNENNYNKAPVSHLQGDIKSSMLQTN